MVQRPLIREEIELIRVICLEMAENGQFEAMRIVRRYGFKIQGSYHFIEPDVREMILEERAGN